MTHKEFIEVIAKYVIKYANDYGIKVHSPIIAQAILESGWGGSTLASKYNNFFGLKCGGSWKGKSVNMATKEEYTVGTLTDIRANFRVYDTIEDGVKGYFEFINYSRYSNLKGVTNPEEYCRLIKADGYATSSTYVTNLMRVIRDNNLTFMITKELSDEGIFVNPVVSPAVAPHDTLIRFSLMATHTKEQVTIALETIQKIFRKYNLNPKFNLCFLIFL